MGTGFNPFDHAFEKSDNATWCRACGMGKDLHKDLPPGAQGHGPVNHPSHYTTYKGLEVIDLTEQMNFNLGNAVKYVSRAGLKNPTINGTVEDLRKAVWYIEREIQRITKE